MDLSFAGLDSKQAAALAAGLTCNTNIHNLVLRNNSIGDIGCAAICNALASTRLVGYDHKMWNLWACAALFVASMRHASHFLFVAKRTRQFTDLCPRPQREWHWKEWRWTQCFATNGSRQQVRIKFTNSYDLKTVSFLVCPVLRCV